MGVLLPPKVYLDTNHLIEITRARKSVSRSAYSLIDNYLQEGLFSIIFNPAAALEWVDEKATMESAKEIAEVVDCARVQYEIEKDSFVFLHEIQRELRRIEPGIRLPDFDVLHLRDFSKAARRALPVLKKSVPGFFEPGEVVGADVELPQEIRFGSAGEHVERAYLNKTERPEVFRERVDGGRAAYVADVEALAKRSGRSFARSEIVAWMKRFVRVERVVAAFNPDVPVDELLSRVDLANCPAVNLFLKAHTERVRAGHKFDKNDVDDWMIVHIVPFADMVLTERRLSHFIRQADRRLEGRVTHDAESAIRILAPWIG
ncbi:MAG: hypothetical protein HQ582_06680 [Planctomycetes bacterium]|nr:hypothetical protein [Planctomycetota bacterium]